MNRKLSREGKKLLSATISSVEFGNRMKEEKEMWDRHSQSKKSHRHRPYSTSSSSHKPHRDRHHRSSRSRHSRSHSRDHRKDDERRKVDKRPEPTGESTYYSKKSSNESDVNNRKSTYNDKELDDRKRKIFVQDIEMSDEDERSERDDLSHDAASHPSGDATTDERADAIVSPSRSSEEIEDFGSPKNELVEDEDNDSSTNHSVEKNVESTPEPREESVKQELDVNKEADVSGEIDEPKKEEPPSYYYPAIQGCRSVDEFERLNKIEEGTYGVVYRAEDKRSGEIVALKRVKMEKEKEGFPITSLREISTLLKAAQHPNIVSVKEIVVGSNIDSIFIVMEYVEHDLKSLMSTMKRHFTLGEVKTLMLQLLSAVAHLHDNWILHRDLKTSNLLFSHKGILKVSQIVNFLNQLVFIILHLCHLYLGW